MGSQAPKAVIAEALDLGLQAWRTTPVREKFLAAFDALDVFAASPSVPQQDGPAFIPHDGDEKPSDAMPPPGHKDWRETAEWWQSTCEYWHRQADEWRERAESVPQQDELREALRDALDCKGSYEGTVSEHGGYPAICSSCADKARAALASSQVDGSPGDQP